ncbi:MAG: hypothetical protein LLG20_27620 [Acidobacteriales bacterium]|nr:hypothetical protein [Terriglobales bacterium]
MAFRSTCPLANVGVEITPSLNGLVVISPNSFASIVPNQDYHLSLTFTAPPEFVRRAFGGTIHIRNNGIPSKTYSLPLEIALRADWSVFIPSSEKYSINYPATDVSVFELQPGTVLFRPQEGDSLLEVPYIFISMKPNPAGKNIFDFYKDPDQPDLLAQSGGNYTTGTVNGALYYIFNPTMSEAGMMVVVVPRPGYFLELDVSGASSETPSGVFGAMLSSLMVE